MKYNPVFFFVLVLLCHSNMPILNWAFDCFQPQNTGTAKRNNSSESDDQMYLGYFFSFGALLFGVVILCGDIVGMLEILVVDVKAIYILIQTLDSVLLGEIKWCTNAHSFTSEEFHPVDHINRYHEQVFWRFNSMLIAKVVLIKWFFLQNVQAWG